MSKEPRELKHCFALIHKDANKYEDWIILGLPQPSNEEWECIELKEIVSEPSDIEGLLNQIKLRDAELSTITRKSEELCDAYGKALIQIHDLTAKVKRYEEYLTEEFFMKIITEWKFSWMNQRQNDRKDFENYLRRAFGVDANMKHDLASRLARAALNQGEGKVNE